MEPLDSLREEFIDGLLYCHHRANSNTEKALEVAAFAYALIELLIEKGLLAEDELNERERQVANSPEFSRMKIASYHSALARSSGWSSGVCAWAAIRRRARAAATAA
jgi:hypothetical protein